MLRSFVAVCALACASVAVRAADDENPYKNAKKGDFATYTITTKAAGNTFEGVMTQAVTDRTDKEVTLKVTGTIKIGDKEMKLPDQEMKVDLTKPYDPTKSGNLPAGAEVKSEKLKDGKEKIKVAGKEYDAAWTTYKMTIKVMGLEIAGETKVWTAKDAPMGLLKSATASEFGGMKTEIIMELKETGNKK